MAAQAPTKLGFTLASCSGEHPDYPATELLQHRPQSRGWQSARNAAFPQELAFVLDTPARLTQLQILSHEYKIASRVEVFVAPPGVAVGAAAPSWRRLGFLSLDANEQSGHQARELKSVQLDAPAGAVRLLLHGPHANRFNTAEQVGIVALNLIGLPLAGPVPAANGVLRGAAPPALRRSSIPGGLDAETAAQVATLQQLKVAAVEAEDYDEAKRLKSAIDRLTAVGGQLGQLEAAKADAIAREDYDAAKALKADIARLRAGASDSPALQQPLARRPQGPPSSMADGASAASNRPGTFPVPSQQQPRGPPPPQQPSPSHDDLPVGGSAGKRAEMPPEFPPEDGAAPAAGADGDAGSPGRRPAAAAQRRQQRPSSQQGLADSPSKQPPARTPPATHRAAGEGDNLTPAQAYDDRPAKAGGAYAVPETPDLAAAVPPAAAHADPPAARVPRPSRRPQPPPPSAAAGGSAQQREDRPPSTTAGTGGSGRADGRGGGGVADGAPAGWDTSLPAPEQLPPGDAQLAEPLEPALGTFLCSSLFSKTWQLREAALKHICRGLQDGTVPHDSGSDAARDLVRNAGPPLQRLLRDKVGSVLVAAQQVAAALLRAHGAAAGRDAARLVQELLPVLLDRAGDANARISKGVEDAVAVLAEVPEAALASHTGAFVRPIKNQAAWKPVLGRLRLLDMLLPRLGISRGSDSGFQPEPLMGFVSAALSNANAEVRALATSVAAAAGAMVGPAEVQRHLPKDLNPKLREALSEALVQTGALSPDALKQPSAPVRPARASLTPPGAAAPGGGRKENLPPGKPRGGGSGGAPASATNTANGQPAKATKPVAKAQPPAKQQKAAPSKKAVPAKAHAAEPAPQAAASPLPPVQHEEDYGPPADPAAAEAMLLRGLAEAELRFGKTSAQAADAAAQLGVLYSQVGDAASAGPLFERALTDLETALGPDHPDVAHAAIDLGVLRLEQGNEAEGRPLLERALRIQSAVLGPDHPDVLAIRDVLEEDS